ncbi:MAG TPA: YdeI/OmpD-associated family protein, partial [Naasia sp.]
GDGRVGRRHDDRHPRAGEGAERLGRGSRFPVVVTLGDYSYRSTVTPYRGRIMLSLSAENREGAGVAAGDTVTVTLAPDDAPRVTEVPDDLRAAIDGDDAAKAFFAGLAPSHQKAYVVWIIDAKKAETRAARVEKAVEMLKEGRRR